MSAPVGPRGPLFAEQMYGPFPLWGDPRAFEPDPQCSTPEERQAHKLACEALNRGEEVAIGGPTCSLGGSTYAFGHGTLTFFVTEEEHAAMYADDGPADDEDDDRPF